ncbi:MAG: hypothetical protein HP498_10155 [Nitrospira sp.]|nr:hypothetical protein [Nitrospira sp.]
MDRVGVQESVQKQLFARIETTETSWSAMQIWPLIKEAILLLWIRRQHFWPLLALPVALTTLLSLGDYWFLSDRPRSVGLLLQIPNFLIFSFFAVACHRSILIGEHSVSRFGISGWPHREFRFFFWLIVIYIIGGMSWLFTSEVVERLVDFIGTFWGEESKELQLRLPGSKFSVDSPWRLLGLMPCGYLIGRLSLLLPAIAVDDQASLRSVWSQSKGNGWRMALLVGWMPILIHILEQIIGVYFGFYIGSQFTSYSLGVYVGLFSVSEAFVRYTFFTIEVAILSLSFLKLSGWHTSLVPQNTTIDHRFISTLPTQ